jgi:hypothetical protein
MPLAGNEHPEHLDGDWAPGEQRNWYEEVGECENHTGLIFDRELLHPMANPHTKNQKSRSNIFRVMAYALSKLL